MTKVDIEKLKAQAIKMEVWHKAQIKALKYIVIEQRTPPLRKLGNFRRKAIAGDKDKHTLSIQKCREILRKIEKVTTKLYKKPVLSACRVGVHETVRFLYALNFGEPTSEYSRRELLSRVYEFRLNYGYHPDREEVEFIRNEITRVERNCQKKKNKQLKQQRPEARGYGNQSLVASCLCTACIAPDVYNFVPRSLRLADIETIDSDFGELQFHLARLEESFYLANASLYLYF